MLFDKNGRGSEELQKVTGIWYASTPFSVIRTEIRFAEEAVATIFGDAVYRAAVSAYEDSDDNAFVDAFQLLADNFDDVLDSVLNTIEDVLKDDTELKRVKQLEKDISSIETKKAG